MMYAKTHTNAAFQMCFSSSRASSTLITGKIEQTLRDMEQDLTALHNLTDRTVCEPVSAVTTAEYCLPLKNIP